MVLYIEEVNKTNKEVMEKIGYEIPVLKSNYEFIILHMRADSRFQFGIITKYKKDEKRNSVILNYDFSSNKFENADLISEKFKERLDINLDSDNKNALEIMKDIIGKYKDTYIGFYNIYIKLIMECQERINEKIEGYKISYLQLPPEMTNETIFDIAFNIKEITTKDEFRIYMLLNGKNILDCSYDDIQVNCRTINRKEYKDLLPSYIAYTISNEVFNFINSLNH